MRIETLKENETIVDKKLVSVSQSDLKDGYKLKVPEGVTIIGSDIFCDVVSKYQ